MNDLVYKNSWVFVLLTILFLSKSAHEFFATFHSRRVYKLLVVFAVLLWEIFDGFAWKLIHRNTQYDAAILFWV